MEESPTSYLRRAKALYEEGRITEAEALLEGAEGLYPSEAGIRTFRAYLLYREGRLEKAAEAYRLLAEEFGEEHSHLSNLGLIYFKQEKYVEAREVFEKLLLLRPDDPRTLRNLGFCFRKLGNEGRAQQYLRRAGREVGTRLPAEGQEGAEAAPAGGGEGVAPPHQWAAAVSAYVREAALPLHGRAGELFRRGKGVAVCRIDEKLYIKRRHLLSYRGVVVFSSASREAGQAAVKFGDPEMELIRVEGSGEIGLGGKGADLHFFHLDGDQAFHVNYPFLVCHGPAIDTDYDFNMLMKGTFLPARLSGAGGFVMACAGEPFVLEVSEEMPAFVRAACVLGWSGDLVLQREDGPALKGFLTRKRGGDYLFFEGGGYLLLQDCPS